MEKQSAYFVPQFESRLWAESHKAGHPVIFSGAEIPTCRDIQPVPLNPKDIQTGSTNLFYSKSTAKTQRENINCISNTNSITNKLRR